MAVPPFFIIIADDGGDGGDFIRRFFDLLEHPGGILEVLDHLLEQHTNLLENRRTTSLKLCDRILKNAYLIPSAAFIRTFYAILEHPADILEVLDRLLEDPGYLFEHRRLILEVRCFIRTFLGLLEHLANLLENAYLIFIGRFYWNFSQLY
ncbi:hypothetical protein ACPA0F_08170 [Solibacillus silvestris]